jgi:hypothetical protein
MNLGKWEEVEGIVVGQAEDSGGGKSRLSMQCPPIQEASKHHDALRLPPQDSRLSVLLSWLVIFNIISHMYLYYVYVSQSFLISTKSKKSNIPYSL